MWALSAVALSLGCAGGAPEPSPELQLSLVATLDLSEPPGASGRGSRAQAVFLKSMATQHPALALSIVDVSELSERERRNRAVDWGLSDWTIRVEPDGGPSPVVTLIVAGEVQQRWVGFTDAATLDQALEGVLGSRGGGRQAPALIVSE